MQRFQALRVDAAGEGRARLEQLALDDLSPGDVVIRVEYSDINYKDALAVSGRGKIIRNFPLNAGIDLSGEIVTSGSPDYRPGDKVLVMGCGMSETHDGGYAEYARVRSEWIVPLPPGMDTREAMILGTAGFTAAFAIHRLEQNRQRPELGEILVTGATGGVGSVAIMMLAKRGYEVVALTGKAEAEGYLKSLGASRIVLRGELDMGKRPLETAAWAGAVDNLGGEVLGWLTRSVATWGNIASIGLAASPQLETTVMPFILRGVSLIGINAGLNPREERLEIWERMGADLKPDNLDRVVTRTVGLEDITALCDGYLEGSVTGRTLVNIGG